MKTFFSFFGGALGVLVALSLIIIIPIVGIVMLVAALPAIDTARKAARKHNELRSKADNKAPHPITKKDQEGGTQIDNNIKKE